MKGGESRIWVTLTLIILTIAKDQTFTVQGYVEAPGSISQEFDWLLDKSRVNRPDRSSHELTPRSAHKQSDFEKEVIWEGTGSRAVFDKAVEWPQSTVKRGG